MPGLAGWGVIRIDGHHLRHGAHGTVSTPAGDGLDRRLVTLFEGLRAVLADWQPDEVAVEETFVSKDARASLKLGHARAVALLAPALQALPVVEYAPNQVKKAVVGAGHADKAQIRLMVHTLLPGASIASADAADALAVAICHAHRRPPAHVAAQVRAAAI